MHVGRYVCRPSRYQDGSFDAVVDKGTLDALMSEDTADVRESGQAMIREVARVLKPGGRCEQEKETKEGKKGGQKRRKKRCLPLRVRRFVPPSVPRSVLRKQCPFEIAKGRSRRNFSPGNREGNRLQIASSIRFCSEHYTCTYVIKIRSKNRYFD